MNREYKIGTMLEDIESVGTQLKLKRGDKVRVYKATNLPDDSPFKYFVAPIKTTYLWEGFSIGAYETDVTF